MNNSDIEFRSLKELYERVKPALYSKLKEMNNLGFKYVTYNDIWNYLVDNSWKNKKGLELHELITDIINVNNYDVNEYVMAKLGKIKSQNDTPNFDSESLF